MDNQDQQNQEESGPVRASEVSPQLIDDDPTRLVRSEVLPGTFPGNERVRVVLTNQRAFRRISTGVLEATEFTQAPRRGLARIFYQVKRALIGAPLATAQAEQERLSKFKALAVLSSDAISSVAYATEAILISLVAAGSGALG